MQFVLRRLFSFFRIIGRFLRQLFHYVISCSGQQDTGERQDVVNASFVLEVKTDEAGKQYSRRCSGNESREQPGNR